MTNDIFDIAARIYGVVHDCETQLTQILGIPVKVSFINDNELTVATGDISNPFQRTVMNAPVEFTNRTTETVAQYYGLTVEQLKSNGKNRPLPEARYMIWHLIKLRYPNTPTARLGELFNRDHSSVVWGLRTLRGWIESGEGVKNDEEQLKQLLKIN